MSSAVSGFLLYLFVFVIISHFPFCVNKYLPSMLSYKFLFISEFIILYFYELFNRFSFSLLHPT